MEIRVLRRLLDERKAGVSEITREYLKRIERENQRLNCYISVCGEEALKQAELAQKRIDRGEQSILTGIPLAVKDNICIKGIPATCGSRMLRQFVPSYSSTAAERILSSGGIILGKTNLDEFAMGSSGRVSAFGAVENPAFPGYITGGSSSGSAAAVAAELCCAALGSDTGGSVRQPAAFCGITGLKPTYGRVSRWGLIAFASSLDHIGILAQSPEDAGYLLDVIAGADGRDMTAANREDRDFTGRIRGDFKGAVIGLPKEFFTDQVDSEVKGAVLAAAKVYETMGAVVQECSIPAMEYTLPAYYMLSSAEAASNLGRYDGIRYGHRSEQPGDYARLTELSRSESFGPEVKRRILLGNYGLREGFYQEYYGRAVQIRRRLTEEYERALEQCRMLLIPTTPRPPRVASETVRPVEEYQSDRFTVGINLTGLPAIAVPCGYTGDGLPVSMTLIGRRFEEREIIGAAALFKEGTADAGL